MKTRITTLIFSSILFLGLISNAHASSSNGVKSLSPSSMSFIVNNGKVENHKTEAKLKLEAIKEKPGIRYSKTNPEYVILQQFDENLQEWVNVMKIKTIADELKETEIYEMYKGDVSVPYLKIVSHLNKTGVVIETDSHVYEAGKWVLTEKHLQHRDDHGNQVIDAYLQWNDIYRQWDTISGTKYDYIYSKDGLLKQITESYFNLWRNVWTPVRRDSFNYNSMNLVSELIVEEYKFNSGAFENLYREEYTYNRSREWDQVSVFYAYKDQWIKTMVIDHLQWHDFSEMKPLYYVVYNVNEKPELLPSKKALYAYHPLSGEPTLFETYVYNETWTPEFREITNFDHNFMPVYYSQELFTREWEILFALKSTFEYNKAGDLLIATTQLFNTENSKWENILRILYIYKDNFEKITFDKGTETRFSAVNSFSPASMSFIINNGKNETRKSSKVLKLDAIKENQTIRYNKANPEYVIMQEYDQYTQEWLNSFKIFTIADDLSETEIYEVFEGTVSVPYMKIVSHLDKWGIVYETDTYYYEAGKWVVTEKHLQHRDEYGNLVIDAYLQWNDIYRHWDTISGQKFENLYTKNGLLQQVTESYFNTLRNTWVPVRRDSFTQNFMDLVSELIVEEYNQNSERFEKTYREEYTYNRSREWIEVVVYEAKDEWVMSSVIDNLQWHDFANKLPLYYIVNNVTEKLELLPFQKAVYEYHPLIGECISYELYVYQENWMPEYREITVFDENLMPVYISQEMFHDNWEVLFALRVDYEYSNSGYLLTATIMIFDNEYSRDWENALRIKYFYGEPSKDVTFVPSLPSEVRIVNAYPNPAVNHVSLRFETDSPKTLVQIYNTSGQIVKQEYLNDTYSFSTVDLDISSLKSGIYLMNIHSENQVQSIRLMKR
jgi:hypothetical protein